MIPTASPMIISMAFLKTVTGIYGLLRMADCVNTSATATGLQDTLPETACLTILSSGHWKMITKIFLPARQEAFFR